PWLSGEIIEIRNVVAGLVALRINSYQACGVRKLAEVFILRRSILLDKELIQLGIEILTPPHQANQTCNVMLYVEGISPRIHLGEVIPAALPSAKLWIKGRHPLPICALRSHEAYLRIEDIAIVVSQLHEVGIIILLAKNLCQLRCTPVVIARLQCHRDRLPPFARHLRNRLSLPHGKRRKKSLLKVHM